MIVIFVIKMEDELKEFEDMTEKWYATESIAYEMINTMKLRESVFIATNRRATQRCLKINAVRFLFMNFKRYKAFEDDYQYNIYHSVSHFPNLPMFSFKWDDKKEQMAKFNLEYETLMTGYDFFLDLDNENLELVYSSTKVAKELFDKFKIIYNLVFSGKKGFHINVEYKDLPKAFMQIEYKKLARLFKLFAYELKICKNIRDIDTSIFDLRRIKKVPYSVVYPYYNIALPLSNEQFDNFSFKEMNIANWIDRTNEIKQRGLLTRVGSPENLLLLMMEVSQKRKDVGILYKIFKIKKQTLNDYMKELKLL